MTYTSGVSGAIGSPVMFCTARARGSRPIFAACASTSHVMDGALSGAPAAEPFGSDRGRRRFGFRRFATLPDRSSRHAGLAECRDLRSTSRFQAAEWTLPKVLNNLARAPMNPS